MSKMINCENCGGKIDPNYNFCQYCGCLIDRYIAEDGMEFYNLYDFCEYEWSYNKGFAKENIFLYDENLNKIICYDLKGFDGSLNFAKFIYIAKPLSERFSFALKK